MRHSPGSACRPYLCGEHAIHEPLETSPWSTITLGPSRNHLSPPSGVTDRSVPSIVSSSPDKSFFKHRVPPVRTGSQGLIFLGYNEVKALPSS
jgi:hypothetical protein